MAIQAIQTRYAGCHFRSRLEARWAVFFNKLGISWKYEPEGFVVRGSYEGDRDIPYLPDFYLPGSKTWVEVKGSEESFQQQGETYANAIDWGGDIPDVEDSHGTGRGLLVLGPIPPDYNPDQVYPLHWVLQHHKGIYANWATFGIDGVQYICSNDMVSSAPELPVMWTPEGPSDRIKWTSTSYLHWPSLAISWDTTRDDGVSNEWLRTPAKKKNQVSPGVILPSRSAGVVHDAYTAARSARFEHGQSGAA